jgi:hypothetical protein
VSTYPTGVDGRAASTSWKSAECSLSTGISSPLPRRLASSARSPPATRLSLFASASRSPRSSVQSVARNPAKPTIALSTTSGSARSSNSIGSPPTDLYGASTSSSGVDADEAATSSSRGSASITASV